MSITFKGNEDSIRNILIDFIRLVRYSNEREPGKSDYDLADSYIQGHVSAEEGMDEFYKSCQEVERKNNRILRAVKSVMGRTFYLHLVAYLRDAQAVSDATWEIVRQPEGELQKVTEYGRAIRQEWVQQWSIGTEGDSYEGIICIPLKPRRYLKFHFSM